MEGEEQAEEEDVEVFDPPLLLLVGPERAKVPPEVATRASVHGTARVRPKKGT